MRRWATNVALGLTVGLGAGAPAEDDPLAALSVLQGEWAGAESGSFGEGQGTRSYRRILDDHYLLSENRSVFPPQPGLPEGNEHRDWTIFSFDSARGLIVVRQFNSEGFVNRLVQEKGGPGDPLVFVSEASENAPPGLRARLTLDVVSDTEFHETFELASAGQDFRVVLRNRWTRVRATGP